MGTVEADLDRYLVEESKREALASFIENEMIRYKQEAIRRFFTITKPIFAEDIAVTIAFGYREMLPEAKAMIKELDLEEKHIAALMDDSEALEKIIEKEEQDTFEEYLYASINY